MAVESTIWLFGLLTLFCGPSKQGKALTFIFMLSGFFLCVWYACVRQRSRHVTLKCSYSQHKWAVNVNFAPCMDRTISHPCSVFTSCGLSARCQWAEDVLLLKLMGDSRRTLWMVLAWRSCSLECGHRADGGLWTDRGSLGSNRGWSSLWGRVGLALVLNKSSAPWKQQQ